ncbi:hypothetical protein Halar_0034 (plasmid) [halophilic archaeon DL31]|nr:hypothetical protein Halar_0034 [halophilic archaeon DL31]
MKIWIRNKSLKIAKSAMDLLIINTKIYSEMKEGCRVIPTKTLLEQIKNQFDEITEIYVAHLPTVTDVSKLHITIHTDEAESLEQYIELTAADEVIVDIGEDEPVILPFQVMATFDGPGHIDYNEGTTVYMADSVLGVESRELDTGLTILRQKLAGVCPSCRDYVGDVWYHYIDNYSCRRVEEL